MRKTVFVFACVMLVAGVAGAQQGPNKPDSDVYDVKSYNGNFCKARYGDQVADFTWLVRGIKNISSEYREISCPVIQDNYLGLGEDAHWALSFHNPGGDFCCTLYSFTYPGDSIFDSHEYCIDVAWWGHIYLSPVAQGYSTYLGLHCILPPNSTLFKYEIDEHYQTDQDN